MSHPILDMQHVTKRYPGVLALNDVSLSFQAGQAHAIVGENGAGKSTFIKCVTGAITPDTGEIRFDGEILSDNSPQRSLALGIAAIYQEFSLVPHLSVGGNVFFGRYPTRHSMIDEKALYDNTAAVFEELGVAIDPRAEVAQLSVGYQQLVEIARALSRDPRVLIMDEPSAPLTEAEMVHLYRVIQRLKARGVAIIYISHRLTEVFEVCETVSVLRDGQLVRTMPTAETTQAELIRLMVDREVSELYPRSRVEPGRVRLEVDALSTEFVRDISFSVREGEIVGLAGLVGAGRTEVARAVFGADPKLSGTVRVDGVETRIDTPRHAVAAGIGLIPEDRKAQGLLMNLDIADNVAYSSWRKVSTAGVIDPRRLAERVSGMTQAMRVKAPTVHSMVRGLSGGNQQKVVLAKWLLTDCRIMFFDEPTRGIDVGAKQEIYELMRTLADEGAAIVMVSSELPELLGMSDRVIVMHEGRITGELSREEASPEKVMSLASRVPPPTSGESKQSRATKDEQFHE